MNRHLNINDMNTKNHTPSWYNSRKTIVNAHLMVRMVGASFLCLATAGMAHAAQQVALRLVGQWSTAPNTMDAEDVAVAGNYAYIAAGPAGLQVVDISDPVSPKRVGGCSTSATLGVANGVAASGHYAYVADGYAGLQVIDVSDPAAPRKVGGYSFSPLVPYARDVKVAGNYVYIAASNGGLKIFDVTNPASPKPAGGLLTTSAFAVAVSGNLACVASGDFGGMSVIDIGNPASPKWLGGFITPGIGQRVAIAGQYAYIADGDTSMQTLQTGLHIIDVSSPAKPKRVGYYLSRDANCVVVAGDYAFMTGGNSRLDNSWLNAMNVAKPANPQLAGTLTMAGSIQGLTVSGSYIYLANNDRGLAIVRLGTPPILQSAQNADGPYTDLANARMDTALKIIYVTPSATAQFFRLKSNADYRFEDIRVAGSELAIKYLEPK